MPNYSTTRILFASDDQDALETVKENVEKHGFDWGKWKEPKVFRLYDEAKVVPDRKWTEILDGVRKRRNRIVPGRLLISVGKTGKLPFIKRSVADRILDRYGTMSRYDWRIRNWGTKWNLDEENRSPVYYDGFNLEYVFSSPWSGPLEWFTGVCREFGLDGKYVDYEPGNDFFVKVVMEKGELREMIETEMVSEASVEELGLYNILEMYDNEEAADWLMERLPERREEIAEYFDMEDEDPEVENPSLPGDDPSL